jgi:hypothetical protein
MNESERRRWINLGELIALAALIVSAIGVWIAWKSTSSGDKPTRVIEQRQPIPLTLRAKADGSGRQLVISPVESGHALESLTLTIKGARPVELGSDGTLDASDLESALKSRDEDKGAHSVPIRIDAHYVEMGKDRHASGTYVLRYRWEGGGLLGRRSLRLTGLGR